MLQHTGVPRTVQTLLWWMIILVRPSVLTLESQRAPLPFGKPYPLILWHDTTRHERTTQAAKPPFCPRSRLLRNKQLVSAKPLRTHHMSSRVVLYDGPFLPFTSRVMLGQDKTSVGHQHRMTPHDQENEGLVPRLAARREG